MSMVFHFGIVVLNVMASDNNFCIDQISYWNAYFTFVCEHNML
jgi:hypothetical protein